MSDQSKAAAEALAALEFIKSLPVAFFPQHRDAIVAALQAQASAEPRGWMLCRKADGFIRGIYPDKPSDPHPSGVGGWKRLDGPRWIIPVPETRP